MIENFRFKKKFGQNFIHDKNLLNEIANFANIDNTSTIVEIGTGEGTLTERLCEKAKRVVSFEIDEDLQPFLNEKFKHQANLTLIFKDALKIPNDEINKIANEEFALVANLPYYITTPLIFKFLENEK